MASRQFSARAFLSLAAGVDDDSESSDGFDEELDGQEGPREEPERIYARSQRVADSSRRFIEEDVEDMVARYRSMDRDARNKEYSSLEEAFDSSLGATQARLPCAKNDISMFGMICKVKWEETLVIRLHNKVMADTLDRYKLTSVFSVAKSPGRIYFEALSMEHIKKTCKGIEFLYPSTLFSVPLEERVSLLQSVSRTPTLKEGDRVKIRNGLYKGDIGSVFRAVDNSSNVVVKLKSREVHPGEKLCSNAIVEQERAVLINSEDSNHYASNLGRKRKRRQQRAEPYLLPRHPLKPELLLDETRVALSENGFVLLDKEYTDDGYRLLELQFDRIERILADEEPLEGITGDDQPTASSPSDVGVLPEPPLSTSTASTPRFLRVGNQVLVSSGPMKGMKGTINNLFDESAVITLDEKGRPHDASPVQAEVAILDIVRLFDLGETIKVKVGKHAEKFGVVGDIQGVNLLIVDWINTEVIAVNSNFVDSFAVQVMGSHGQIDMALGDRVLVLKGKYGGKEGMLLMIRRYVVVVLEDISGIQITTGRENIRFLSARIISANPLPAKTKEDTEKMDRQRDSFKDLANSIGMNLNEFAVFREGVMYFHQKVCRNLENPPEPWTLMKRREVRIARFWRLVESYGFNRGDLVGFSDDEPAPVGIEAERHRHLKGFLTFAKGVTVTIGDRPIEIPVQTVIREQSSWEFAFIDLAKSLDISVEYVGPRIVECNANHVKDSFEGKRVYVWKGHYKGRLGIVKEMNNEACRVALETPFFGVTNVVIRGVWLLGECGCILASGEKPDWCANMDLVFPLFNRSSAAPRELTLPRAPTPPSQPTFHDDAAPGMWLFHPRIAALRRTNSFLIKIESHPDSEVSGRREGKVLFDANPPSSPLPVSALTSVLVEYNVKKKNETRTELLPVSSLAVTRPKVKGRHAIISGPRTGDVVVYVRSEAGSGLVHSETNSQETCRISKTIICAMESI